MATIVPMAPFTPKSTSKLRSALICANTAQSYNNDYNHGFPNTFDYNHYVYNDYLVCSVPDIVHIIRYEYLWHYCNYDNKRPIYIIFKTEFGKNVSEILVFWHKE